MALNAEVSFTWIGHGTWKVRSAKGKKIYIDPLGMNNPVAPEALKKVEQCDLMPITHGHFDHVYDALEIAKATRPKIVTNYEIGAWLGSKGIDGDSIMGVNPGNGRHRRRNVTLVHAEHTCDIPDGDQILYGGAPMAL